MKCSSCGTTLKGDSKFCMNCGAEIGSSDANVRFSRPPEQYAGPKKLYRSRSDRMIAGVCGGLGDYFDMDSNLIRVILVLFTAMGGAGLLFYLIMIVVIPESPYDPWSEKQKVAS